MAAWRRWWEPGRRLPAMFFAIAILVAGMLPWLGWRLAEQDRQTAVQRLQEARESTADLAVAALQKALSHIEERLSSMAALPAPELRQEAARLAGTLPDDSLVVLLHTGGAIEAFPEKRLLFYPDTQTAASIAIPVFAEAEALEFRRQDYSKALAALAPLAQSADPAARAAAGMRVARIHRKQGRWQDAIAVYRRMAELGGALADGLPAELVARHAQMGILARRHEDEAARREAAAVLDILRERRYPVGRGAYEFFQAEALRVRGAAPPAVTPPPGFALAAATESFVELAQAGEATPGRRLFRENSASTLALWRASKSGLHAMLLGPAWVERQWQAVLGPARASQAIALRLTDTEGQPVWGEPATSPAGETIRLAAATQLPWNLHAITTRPELVLGPSEVRRKWLIAALTMIAVLILASSYLVGRAVNRELAVSRLQSDFVSAVSHEFRTPLTSLCLLSEQLAAGKVEDECARSDYYRTLSRESQRLRRLVEGLLNFGRVEAGSTEYRFEIQDPAELVRETARQFESDVEAEGYHVEVLIDDNAPLVRADRAAIACTVWNLLDNAVKYSPGCRTVWASVTAEDGRAAIGIRDRGLGIPAAEQACVFDKFVRGEAARQAGIRGTGVGLALVRRIVAAHGGEIRLESEAGEGSTFTVLLPAVN